MNEMIKKSVSDDSHGGMPDSGKSVYQPPKLVKYGSVAAITGSSDACSGFDKMDVNQGPMPDMATGRCT